MTEIQKIAKKLTKSELLDLAIHYDWYIQDANEKNLYKEGWQPVCIAEFYDCEYQDILSNRKKDIQPTYSIDENDCEHLYRDGSDDRYCVDCGKKLDRADCGNCGRPATHSAGGINRCDRCKDL